MPACQKSISFEPATTRTHKPSTSDAVQHATQGTVKKCGVDGASRSARRAAQTHRHQACVMAIDLVSTGCALLITRLVHCARPSRYSHPYTLSCTFHSFNGGSPLKKLHAFLVVLHPHQPGNSSAYSIADSHGQSAKTHKHGERLIKSHLLRGPCALQSIRHTRQIRWRDSTCIARKRTNAEVRDACL